MRLLRELLAAVQFLTRLPVPAYRFEPDMVVGSTRLYPIVGALVGLGAVAMERLLRGHLPVGVLAAAVLVYFVILTGGMHEDGLADTLDGLGSGGERKRMLDIMRDSRIGSYGALAIVFSVLVRWVLLGTIPPGQICLLRSGRAGSLPLDSAAAGQVSAIGTSGWAGRKTGEQNFHGSARLRIGAGTGNRWSVLEDSNGGTGRRCHRGYRRQRYGIQDQTWRYHWRLLRNFQPARGDCRVSVRRVDIGMTEGDPTQPNCTILLLRHAHSEMAGHFCGGAILR